jgi:enoyl-CoA hydratase/carnithine racemase
MSPSVPAGAESRLEHVRYRIDDRLARVELNRPEVLDADAYGNLKRLVHDASTRTVADQLELEASLQQLQGYTEDYVDRVAAFLEKRSPVFRGR